MSEMITAGMHFFLGGGGGGNSPPPPDTCKQLVCAPPFSKILNAALYGNDIHAQGRGIN